MVGENDGKTLRITGDNADSVGLTGGWTPGATPELIDNVAYNVFTQDNGADTYKVLIQTEIVETVS
jgi:hypothetical protein